MIIIFLIYIRLINIFFYVYVVLNRYKLLGNLLDICSNYVIGIIVEFLILFGICKIWCCLCLYKS